MQSVDQISVGLTLVSASPRRKELLSAAGYTFVVAPTHASEAWSKRNPAELAMFNAEKKVRASDFFGNRSQLLIGADTIVVIDDRIFGKPAGIESAERMLRSLSGREHQVITGICLSGPAPLSNNDYIVHTDAAISLVRFHDLAPDTLKTYLESEEWKGKAGAYAIQGLGSQLVEKLTGDFENVVGLPMTLLKNAIAQYFSHCILQP